MRKLATGPLRESETICMWSAPLTLAPGHPLRANQCLFCGLLIGGGLCRITVVVVATTPDCDCGQVPTITQLACAEHGEPTPLQLVLAAARFADAMHPAAGDPCQG